MGHVQGDELDVLQGSRSSLAMGRICVVVASDSSLISAKDGSQKADAAVEASELAVVCELLANYTMAWYLGRFVAWQNVGPCHGRPSVLAAISLWSAVGGT